MVKKTSNRKKRKQQQNFDANFKLQPIGPETLAQQKLDDLYDEVDHFILDGFPGTGKTFYSLFLALDELMHPGNRPPKHKIIIVRSAVQTRDQGALPGSLKEKSEPYELPYKAIFNELFNRGDAYEVFTKKKKLEFMTTSYIRGITIDNAIIIIDEAQNMTFHELDSVITRVGKNTRLMICGDPLQCDFTKRFEVSGFDEMIEIFRQMPNRAEIITFDEDDIVRSGFVKDYIIARENMLSDDEE